MTTFDDILPQLAVIFQAHAEAIQRMAPVYVNRDLNGRVRLIVAAQWQEDPQVQAALHTVAQRMLEDLGAHAFPANQAILFEDNMDGIERGCFVAPLADTAGVWVIDRLATEGNWSTIAPVSSAAPRVVFFSIKGGVGRSTAMAAAAWSLAQQGQRVLVLDLDLESPGLSSSLLPNERRPRYGITDWLVEDLVGNGDAVLAEMVASSTLSRDGDIDVVPAHGAVPGEYVSKLGRAWMPKITPDGRREPWSQRLQRLLNQLEAQLKPDVILIDSRAGIDEVASACVTDLGASLVLLFAIEGEQTWSGYRILFQHWRTTGVVREIRERLQLVGAVIPELGSAEYFSTLRESAWTLFSEELYDEVAPGQIVSGGVWSFDDTEEGAPHSPWPIRWHRGFAALHSLHSRLDGIDPHEVSNVFGLLIAGITQTATTESMRHG
ncbi:MAG: hypothetical protein RLZZ352_404 [Pseudomonadota bacterium]|jgi:hypothetical protein